MGSDFFDGRIARKYHVASKFGYILDGLGDRACHVSAYLLLFIAGVLNVLVVWILIFREVSQYAVRLVETDWHSTQSGNCMLLSLLLDDDIVARLLRAG